MPQPKKGPRLGAGPKHQKLMLSNLAVSLFEHERIRTTEAKAKALRPYAEKLITRAKGGSVHDRRVVLTDIEDRDVVHKLFAEIAPRFSDRNGGYTRILKLGPRNGDGAPMALIELVESARAVSPSATPEDEGGRRRRLRRPTRRRAPAAASTEGADEEDRQSSDVADESADAGADEARTEEPSGQPGDSDAPTSQDEPGDSDEGDADEK